MEGRKEGGVVAAAVGYMLWWKKKGRLTSTGQTRPGALACTGNQVFRDSLSLSN